MRKLRIVSIEGTTLTGGSAFISASLLQHTNQALRQSGHPGLLRDVHVFAGTSAGSWNALYLASHKDPDAALPGLDEYWSELLAAFSSEDLLMLARVAGTAMGTQALMSTRRLRDFFLDFFGHDTRLGDLPRKVIVPSFQLDNRSPNHRHWKPKVFHNFGGPEDPDLYELVADVAMRSGSPPLFTPIYQSVTGTGSGYVDGGIFANNPSMVALSQIIHDVREAERLDLIGNRALLLSLGNGMSQEYIDPMMFRGMADWGYRRWLLDPSDPQVLLRMLFQAGSQAVDYQTRSLLGDDGYYRLNPCFSHPISANPHNVARTMETLPQLPGVGEDIAAAVGWLMSPEVGWMESEVEDSGKAPKRGAAP
ncbi:patatin-like phospholipase family protein [Archangium violaceum]|uniref:patatin-like phospholipase family protein n=1 Tax=Archangium violaceum TaxID=83451 RepID=UPI002B27DA13|nr:patatin-like phospholipase family protein [Archangium gephyra]